MRNKHNQVHTDQNGNSEFVIAGLLPVGKENAVSTEDLVRAVGCSSARELQQCIAQERNAGAIICSSTTGGYYLPANHAEIAEFCKTLESRAVNTLKALRSARRAMRMTDGQQLIEEGRDERSEVD